MLLQAFAQTGSPVHLTGQQLVSNEEKAAARAAAKKAKKDRQKAKKQAQQYSGQLTDQQSLEPSSSLHASIDTLALQDGSASPAGHG